MREPSRRRFKLEAWDSRVTLSAVQPADGSELRNTSEPPGSVSTDSAVAASGVTNEPGEATSAPPQCQRRLRLRPEGSFDYQPGQYVQLRRPDGLARSYSLASLPREGWLELHVRRVTDGRMSSWIFDELHVGGRLELRGPFGDCHYEPGRPEQPLLLAGLGTGLAPLYGIARDALESGHTGPVQL